MKAYFNVFGKQLVRPFELKAADMRAYKRKTHKGVSFDSAEAVKELGSEFLVASLSSCHAVNTYIKTEE